MARQARLKSSTGIYHIMMRGINHQNIFRDDKDRDKFLNILSGAVTFKKNISGREAGCFSIFAYALMGNHIHLLAKVESGELGELIKKIAAGYVRYFNKRYGCDGHLFRERFKSEPCENFNYFCVLMGYIHQNPIKHGFAKKPDEYRYTSWGEYFDPGNTQSKLCDVDAVTAKLSREDIMRWTTEMLPDNLKCIDIDKKQGGISDESIVKYLCAKYGIADPASVKGLTKDQRKAVIGDLLEYGGAVRQISRLTGVNAMTISRINSQKPN